MNVNCWCFQDSILLTCGSSPSLSVLGYYNLFVYIIITIIILIIIRIYIYIFRFIFIVYVPRYQCSSGYTSNVQFLRGLPVVYSWCLIWLSSFRLCVLFVSQSVCRLLFLVCIFTCWCVCFSVVPGVPCFRVVAVPHLIHSLCYVMFVQKKLRQRAAAIVVHLISRQDKRHRPPRDARLVGIRESLEDISFISMTQRQKLEILWLSFRGFYTQKSQ